jgi:hypothetical protein
LTLDGLSASLLALHIAAYLRSYASLLITCSTLASFLLIGATPASYWACLPPHWHYLPHYWPFPRLSHLLIGFFASLLALHLPLTGLTCLLIGITHLIIDLSHPFPLLAFPFSLLALHPARFPELPSLLVLYTAATWAYLPPYWHSVLPYLGITRPILALNTGRYLLIWLYVLSSLDAPPASICPNYTPSSGYSPLYRTPL